MPTAEHHASRLARHGYRTPEISGEGRDGGEISPSLDGKEISPLLWEHAKIFAGTVESLRGALQNAHLQLRLDTTPGFAAALILQMASNNRQLPTDVDSIAAELEQALWDLVPRREM